MRTGVNGDKVLTRGPPKGDMDFSEPEEARQIKKALDGFIEREVDPLEDEHPEFLDEDYERHIVDERNRQVDEYLDVKREIRQKSAEAGFWGMDMPEEVGGGGLSHTTSTVVMEHLMNRAPGFHGAITGGAAAPTPILMECTEQQREEYLEPLMAGEITTCFALSEPSHGSDPHFMETTAERDGDEWVIDGEKCWISNGPYADFAMVFARTSGEPGDVDGITCFLVDSEDYDVGKIHRTMGLTPGDQCELLFDDVRVDEDAVLGEVGGGFMSAMEWVGGGRLAIAAICVGKSQYLLDLASEYAGERETFGKPIGHRQGVSFPIADLASEVEMVRQLYRYAAWRMDEGEPARLQESMAKLRGAELYNQAADVAMQVHGGAGFMKSLPIERCYREARVMRIFEGTDEIQRRSIARELI